MLNYKNPDHVWSIVSEGLQEYEVEEIKYLVGESLIEESIDLRSEMQLLQDISNIETMNHLKTVPESKETKDLITEEILILLKEISMKPNHDQSLPRICNDTMKKYLENFEENKALHRNTTVPDFSFKIDKNLSLTCSKSVAHIRKSIETENELMKKNIELIQLSLELKHHSSQNIEPTIPELTETRFQLQEFIKELNFISGTKLLQPIPQNRHTSLDFNEFEKSSLKASTDQFDRKQFEESIRELIQVDLNPHSTVGSEVLKASQIDSKSQISRRKKLAQDLKIFANKNETNVTSLKNHASVNDTTLNFNQMSQDHTFHQKRLFKAHTLNNISPLPPKNANYLSEVETPRSSIESTDIRVSSSASSGIFSLSPPSSPLINPEVISETKQSKSKSVRKLRESILRNRLDAMG